MRAYDHNGSIADGMLAENGDQALAVIQQLLARPDVTLVHLRNVGLRLLQLRSPACLTGTGPCPRCPPVGRARADVARIALITSSSPRSQAIAI